VCAERDLTVRTTWLPQGEDVASATWGYIRGALPTMRDLPPCPTCGDVDWTAPAELREPCYLRFDADDPAWTAVTFTNGRYAIIYKDTGSAATSPLMGYIDFGANQSPSGIDFTIQFDSTDGALRALVS
jgi:hypothetical protein